MTNNGNTYIAKLFTIVNNFFIQKKVHKHFYLYTLYLSYHINCRFVLYFFIRRTALYDTSC